MRGLKISIFTIGFLIAFLGIFFLFQLSYLKADSPVSLTPVAGTYCDEGYKALSARNMVLFGKTHWTHLDEYAGWVKVSPVSIYFNFIMFDFLGVSLATARLGNLLFAIGCLVLFYLILKRIYDRQHALLGVVLCGVNQLFFFYSRIALFEFKMMFFVLLGVYVMLFVQQHYLLLIPMVASWGAAYYCKPSVQLFFISLILYSVISYKNGVLLNSVLKKRNLVICGLLFIIGFGLLQYFFMFHREPYDSVLLFRRHYRSPAGAAVFWIAQEFFTKNPILSFLALVYSGYLIVLALERKEFSRYDLLFMVWLICGTAAFSFVSFQQLGYYVYVVFPLVALAVRGILSFPLMMKSLFEERYVWFKWIVFSLGFYLLVVHLAFLAFWPVRNEFGWDTQAVNYLGIISLITASLLTVTYFVLKKRENLVERLFGFSRGKYAAGFLVLILLVHLMPISSWAVRPKYELSDISRQINRFKDGSILVGDWAPQLCFDTRHRVLYLAMDRKLRKSQNFNNLDKIRPDYLVIVDGLNDHILQQFNIKYLGVAGSSPHSSYTYAGRNILLYELDFRGFDSS